MTRRNYLLILCVSLINFSLFGQTQQPYNSYPKLDYSIIVASVSLAGHGFHKRQTKKGLDSMYVRSLDPNQFRGMNLQVTKNFSMKASRASDVLFALGIIGPFFLYKDNYIRKDFSTTFPILLQTLSITTMAYTVTAGYVDKCRPYTYNEDVPWKRRCSSKAKNSLYAGHPSITAAGAFYAAQVYSDYYPDSKNKYYVWGAATALTLACSYLRYEGGYHFPIDIVIGTSLGTVIGIMTPILHRNHEALKGNP